MSPKRRSFEPAFSDAERDELGHLHYLDARLDELRARGLIAPDAYATVVAETQGRRRGHRALRQLPQRDHAGEEVRQEKSN